MSPTPKGNPGSWVTSGDYPISALRAEKSGAAGFLLNVNKWGVVADCEITESSGDAALDEATCRNVAVRAKFYPATDKDAKPIAATYRNRVRWVVPQSVPNSGPITISPAISRFVPTKWFPSSPRSLAYDWNFVTVGDYPTKAEVEKRSGTSLFDLSINAEGSVTDCKITSSSGHTDLDQRSCEIATQRGKFIPALDVAGNPSIGRILSGVVWALPQVESVKSTTSYAPPPPRKRPQLFKEPGFAEFEFFVKADGSIGDCKASGDLLKKVGEPSNICDEAKWDNERYEPYLDVSGRPVAKKVTARISVDIADVK
jgi:TonB family protein